MGLINTNELLENLLEDLPVQPESDVSMFVLIFLLRSGAVNCTSVCCCLIHSCKSLDDSLSNLCIFDLNPFLYTSHILYHMIFDIWAFFKDDGVDDVGGFLS